MPKLEPGQTFEAKRTCDPYRPIYYAGASGDFNPIHIDHEVGKKAGLGGAILQGLCTLAWAAETATRHAGDPGALKKIRVRFSKPVLVNDTVTFAGKVASVENGVAKVTL